MKARNNTFKPLIESHRIDSYEDLRRYFRVLAKRLHPDSASELDDGTRFRILVDDFEDARLMLEQAEEPPRKISREDIYSAIWDLEACGFPLDSRVRKSFPLYEKRIEEFDKMLKTYGAIEPYTFRQVEAELNALRDLGIVDNPLFGVIRMILYNLVSWHLEPKRFTKVALLRWYADIEGELLDRHMVGAKAFFNWLMHDIENGRGLQILKTGPSPH